MAAEKCSNERWRGKRDKFGTGWEQAKNRITLPSYRAAPGQRSSSLFSSSAFRLVFEESAKELAHLLLRQGKSLAAAGSGLINTPNLAPFQPFLRTKEPFLFRIVQEGVEVPGLSL